MRQVFPKLFRKTTQKKRKTKMSIVLLGSTGMLGKELVKHFRACKLPIHTPSRKIADISNFLQLNEYFRHLGPVSYIINCAAYTLVDQAETDQGQAFRINALGPKNLSLIANQLKAKLIHFSTDYVFSGKQKQAYLETDACSPLNYYGYTKLEGEKNIRSSCESYLIIRLSWLCGKFGNNFIEKMNQLMNKQKELKIVADQIGSPTFCQSVCQLFPKAFKLGGTFHFTNNGSCSWYEFAREIHSILKESNPGLVCQDIVPISSEQFPTLAKRPLFSVLDTQKIQLSCGIKITPWKQALEYYLQEKINHYQLQLS